MHTASPKTINNLKVHFKRRAFERYGIEVTNEMYDEMCKTIQNGKAKFVKRESNTRTHWVVKIDGLKMYVVYNRKLNAVATALKVNNKLHLFCDEPKLDQKISQPKSNGNGSQYSLENAYPEFNKTLNEYYGFELPFDEYKAVNSAFRTSDATYHGGQGNNRVRWTMTIRDTKVAFTSTRKMKKDDSFLLQAIPMDKIFPTMNLE